MSFFYICDTEIAQNTSKAIALKVIRSRGIEVEPDLNIGVTDLLSTGLTINKNFYNRGYGGITFTISVIFQIDEKTNLADKLNTKHKSYHKGTVLKWIDYHIKHMTPLYVVTSAIDIPNNLYIITDNSRRIQTYKGHTVWELEFTSFTGLNTVKFSKSTKALDKVIKKYKKSKSKSTKKTTSSKSTKKSKLAACKVSQLKYTGKKVTKVKCVSYLQEILYKKHGYLTKRQVDGWYGPKTMNAVKKYQKKYKKKYKLKVTGKVDKTTLAALCK